MDLLTFSRRQKRVHLVRTGSKMEEVVSQSVITKAVETEIPYKNSLFNSKLPYRGIKKSHLQ